MVLILAWLVAGVYVSTQVYPPRGVTEVQAFILLSCMTGPLGCLALACILLIAGVVKLIWGE